MSDILTGYTRFPDDADTSYRDKNGKTSKDQANNVTETAHPDNIFPPGAKWWVESRCFYSGLMNECNLKR